MMNKLNLVGNVNVKVCNFRMIIYQNFLVQSVYIFSILGYPQRMRLQKRLYRIYTVCFLIITIPFSFKTVSSLAKSSKKPLKDHFQGRRLNLTMRWSNFNNFCSYLQSYIFWVTLYIFRDVLYLEYISYIWNAVYLSSVSFQSNFINFVSLMSNCSSL